jgi:hypothetical protein
VLAEPGFVRYKTTDVLGMLPCDYRVVNHTFVKILGCVLEVKLHQLDSIRKGVKWNFYAFCNCDEFFIAFTFGVKQSDWLDACNELFVILELAQSESRELFVEEGCHVENSLVFI